jgi:hypothetical protein
MARDRLHSRPVSIRSPFQACARFSRTRLNPEHSAMAEAASCRRACSRCQPTHCNGGVSHAARRPGLGPPRRLGGCCSGCRGLSRPSSGRADLQGSAKVDTPASAHPAFIAKKHASSSGHTTEPSLTAISQQSPCPPHGTLLPTRNHWRSARRAETARNLPLDLEGPGKPLWDL